MTNDPATMLIALVHKLGGDATISYYDLQRAPLRTMDVWCEPADKGYRLSLRPLGTSPMAPGDASALLAIDGEFRVVR